MGSGRAVGLTALSAWLLCACASGPIYGESDDRALEPVRLAHQTCLQKETVATIHGSDDVNFLVQHIVAQCDDALRPAADYLRGRGFNAYYIDRFIQEKRAHASQVTADFILRVKAIQNGRTPGPPSAAPSF